MSVWSMEMSANLQDMGQKCNPNECRVIYVRKGKQVEYAANLKLDETTLVEKLKTETKCKLLGLRESVMEDEKISTYSCSKDYLQRLSIVWTGPLSDANRVEATNQFAFLVLTYPMWTQQWPLGELQSIDRETRKLISENGGPSQLYCFAQEDLKPEKATVVEKLKTGAKYKFLRVRESMMEDEKLSLTHLQLQQRRTCKGCR